MTRLDSANVNAIDDMFIQHARNCAIHMNLADGVGTLGSIFECIGFESWDHDLVSDTVVVVFTTAILCKVILVNECLALVSKMLQVDNDWNGQEHVLLKHQLPGETPWVL